MDWLRQALTGADNRTVAIGRLVGMAIAIVLLIGLPVVAAGSIIRKLVDVGAWSQLFGSLTIYIPAITLAIGGLIYGTNSTEPTSGQKEGQDHE
ncbi:hypothetical protein [Novosphingobium acidiphilum]|jgi:hypothetical protein|uniref:hypothetical protein n=1 Tax=Novosphingobium acidiphilum TaxID=505248 RepID=UPI000688EC51|nr:hypothetical protein [Novosphingobium acidiphilum]